MKWLSNRRLKINGRDCKNVIRHEVHTKKLTIFRGPASNYDKNCCCIKTVANAVSCGINLSQTYDFVKNTTQLKFSWMKTHPWSFLRSMMLHHLGLSSRPIIYISIIIGCLSSRSKCFFWKILAANWKKLPATDGIQLGTLIYDLPVICVH